MKSLWDDSGDNKSGNTGCSVPVWNDMKEATALHW